MLWGCLEDSGPYHATYVACRVRRSTNGVFHEFDDEDAPSLVEDYHSWMAARPALIASNNTVPWATPANTNSLLPVPFEAQQAAVHTWNLVRCLSLAWSRFGRH